MDGSKYIIILTISNELFILCKPQCTSLLIKAFLDTALALAAGEYFSLVIRIDGSLWASGYNSYRTFGNDSPDQTKFVHIKDGVAKVEAHIYHSFMIKTDKTLWATGENTYYPLGTGDRNDVPVFTKVKVNAK